MVPRAKKEKKRKFVPETSFLFDDDDIEDEVVRDSGRMKRDPVPGKCSTVPSTSLNAFCLKWYPCQRCTGKYAAKGPNIMSPEGGIFEVHRGQGCDIDIMVYKG